METIFDQTDDSVVARLNVDVPDETITSLAEVAARVDVMKTNMELVSRFTGESAEQLLRLAEGQREYSESLDGTINKLEQIQAIEKELDALRRQGADTSANVETKTITRERVIERDVIRETVTATQQTASFNQTSPAPSEGSPSQTQETPAAEGNSSNPTEDTPAPQNPQDERESSSVTIPSKEVVIVSPQEIPKVVESGQEPKAIEAPAEEAEEGEKDSSAPAPSKGKSSNPQDVRDEAKEAGDETTTPGDDTTTLDEDKKREDAELGRWRNAYSAMEQRGLAREVDGEFSFRRDRFSPWKSAGEDDDDAIKQMESIVSKRAEYENRGTTERLKSLANDFSAVTDITDARNLPGALKRTEGFLSGLSSSGVGGGATLAAKAVPVVGGALAAAQVAQMGVDQYSQYRDIGRVQGEGAARGLEAEGQIRAMALNPFITTEQSRQIIMAGMQSGYRGDIFTDAVDFMKTNFEEMGLSVGDSMKLMKKNVDEGGQSIASLNTQLAEIKSSASTGNVSMQAMVQDFTQSSSKLIDQGAGGAQAGELARANQELFQDQGNRLGGEGNTFVTGMISQSNPAMMSEVARRLNIQGRNQTEIYSKIMQQDPSAIQEAAFGIAEDMIAQRYLPPSEENAATFIEEATATLKIPGWGPQQYGELYRQITEKSASGIVGEGEKRLDEERKVTKKGFWDYGTEGIGTVADNAWNTVTTSFGNQWNEVKAAFDPNKTVKEAQAENDKTWADMKAKHSAKEDVANIEYDVPGLEELLTEYKDLSYVDSSGKTVKVDSESINKLSEKELQQLVNSGKWKADAKSEAKSFRDLVNETQTGNSGAATDTTNVNVNIKFTGKAEEYFIADYNTVSAQNGNDGRQLNDKKPGEK